MNSGEKEAVVPGHFSIRIGGVALDVGGDVPVIPDPADAAYAGFRAEPSMPRAGAIRVGVTIAEPRPARGVRKVWQAGDAWAMYRSGERRVICGPRRLRAWRADMEDGSVTVRCGPAMVCRDGGRTAAVNPVRYPLDQLLVMYALAPRGGVILHACGAEFAGKGALFLGRSGAGKTTLARLLAEAGGCTVLSDDRMIVRMANGRADMYGTPWPGEAGMALNRSVPLAACFLLAKAAENRIEDLPRTGVADALLPVASIPWYEKDVAAAVLDTCEALASAVPFRVLNFRKDPDAAAVVREAMERG